MDNAALHAFKSGDRLIAAVVNQVLAGEHFHFSRFFSDRIGRRDRHALLCAGDRDRSGIIAGFVGIQPLIGSAVPGIVNAGDVQLAELIARRGQLGSVITAVAVNFVLRRQGIRQRGMIAQRAAFVHAMRVCYIRAPRGKLHREGMVVNGEDGFSVIVCADEKPVVVVAVAEEGFRRGGTGVVGAVPGGKDDRAVVRLIFGVNAHTCAAQLTCYVDFGGTGKENVAVFVIRDHRTAGNIDTAAFAHVHAPDRVLTDLRVAGQIENAFGVERHAGSGVVPDDAAVHMERSAPVVHSGLHFGCVDDGAAVHMEGAAFKINGALAAGEGIEADIPGAQRSALCDVDGYVGRADESAAAVAVKIQLAAAVYEYVGVRVITALAERHGMTE